MNLLVPLVVWAVGSEKRTRTADVLAMSFFITSTQKLVSTTPAVWEAASRAKLTGLYCAPSDLRVSITAERWRAVGTLPAGFGGGAAGAVAAFSGAALEWPVCGLANKFDYQPAAWWPAHGWQALAAAQR